MRVIMTMAHLLVAVSVSSVAEVRSVSNVRGLALATVFPFLARVVRVSVVLFDLGDFIAVSCGVFVAFVLDGAGECEFEL
jgi:hypothetical protein